MKQYEPCIQNNNNNNNNTNNNNNNNNNNNDNNNNNKKKDKNESKKGGGHLSGERERARVMERLLFFIFSSFHFFLRSMEIGP